MANLVYNSQIIPLNIGVPKLSPPSWPYTSGTYDDTGAYIKSAFTNTSQNPSVITINNGDFNTGSIKSINCYEIHDTPNATLSTIASNVYEVKGIQWTGVGTNTSSVLNRLYPANNTIESYLTTTASTKGNRVCLEGNSALTNIISNGVLDTTHDYFVILHADNHMKHHIAKITEIHKYEVTGDGFDFSPAFDEEVSKGTKIAIYKGPANVDTHIVAVGYGLMGDGADSDYRHDTYVEVSAPTFYFYPDRAPNNKLKANTKYRIIKNIAYITGGNLTFDFGKKSGLAHSLYHVSSPDLQTNGTAICFKTTPAYGDYVIDKSRYTQFGLIQDNLKTHDENISQSSGIMKQSIISAGDSIQNNASVWAQGDYSTIGSISLGQWEKCFFNMKRDKHHPNATNLNLFNSDISRYVEYENSDIKNNIIPQVSSVDMYNSIVTSGNYIEVNVPDPNKIIGFKLNTYDGLSVKEDIFSEDYSGGMNIPLMGRVSSGTVGWTLTFRGLTPSQDLRTIWGSSPTAGLNPDGSGHSNNINKLRIGNIIFAGDFDSAPVLGDDNYEQVFTASHRRNVKTDNTWVVCAGNWSIDSIIEGTARVYAYNQRTDLFIGSYDIDTIYDGTNLKRDGNTIDITESFLSKTDLLIRDKEMTGMRIPIQYGDKNLNYIKPKTSITDRYQMETRVGGVTTNTANSYSIANIPSIYSYINGGTILENNKFDGSIELIEDKTQHGISSFKLTGRDDVIKLLDMVVNEKFTHTNDYIYSTKNPNNDLVAPSDTWEIKDFDIGSTTVSIFRTGATDNPVADGDTLFCNINGKVRLIGIVSSFNASNNISGTYWNGSAHVAIPGTNYGWTITLTEETFYSSINKTYGADTFRIGKPDISLGKALSVNLSDSDRPTSLEGCSNKGMLFIDGEKINSSTGTEEGLLNELSMNESQYSRGFPISNIKGNEISPNFSDYKFNIMGDIAETTTVKHDTISSTTEMAVVKVEALENQLSLVTIAPIFPVILAKTQSNTNDTRINNSQGIYFVNTQGLPNGGFLHYLNSETNNLGASITFTNPGYIDDPTANDGIDYRYEDNYGNYIWRYSGLQDGNSSLVWDGAYIDRVWNKKYKDNGYQFNKMYGSNTGISGYATACRIEYDGTVRAWNYQSSITDHWLQQNSPEGREGFYPLEGSRYWDIVKMSTDIKNIPLVYTHANSSDGNYTTHSASLRSYYPQISQRNGDLTYQWTQGLGGGQAPILFKTKFESFDGNIENFYLFSIGDLYPDSYKRFNSLGFTNRELKNYSIVFKTKGTPTESTINHENYAGSISDTMETDSSYEILPIHSSTKNTSELKRFGLARLIEVTYDWHFNEVDYENLPSIVLNEHKPGYVEHKILGGITEIDTTAYDHNTHANTNDKGDAYITGAGIDGAFNFSNEESEGKFYYTTREGPYNWPTKTYLNLKYIYTDFNNYSTTSKNIFGGNQAELLTFTTTQDMYHVDGNKSGGRTQGSWHTTAGIINGNLQSRVTQQPAGATPGTYVNVNHSATSGDGIGYKCTVILDSATNVSSIIFTSVDSAVFNYGGQQLIMKHRGAKYAAGDTLTFAAADVGGGSQDIVVTLHANDLITEHRIYPSIDYVGSPTSSAYDGTFVNTPIRNTTMRKWQYTGYIKIHADASTKLSSYTSFDDHYTNEGNYMSATSPQAAAYNNSFYYFNYTHILGRINNSGNFYQGQFEGTTISSQSNAEKQDSYHLFIPFFINPDGSAPTRANLHEPITSSEFRFSRLRASTKAELSRVFDKMAQWEETGTINATTNPIGYAPSHLYTDLWAVVKKLKADNQSMVGLGSYTETHTSDGHDHPFELDESATDDVDVTKRFVTETIDEDIYSGTTIPNLHIGYQETDKNSKWLSIRYAFNFEDNTSWPNKTTYSFYGSSANTSFRFLSSDKTNGINYKDLSKCDTQYGAEIYFKPVFNTSATNVTKIELDNLTQSTGIPGSVSVKSNSRTKGRLVFKIVESDITTNANNGKDGNGDTAAFPRINQWLQFANDLTGHYLVSETSSSSSGTITANSKTGRNFIQESIPENIHQIVSHNINQTGFVVTHYIEIDNVTYTNNTADIDMFYRVMRIAKDCTWDFTPSEIELNKLTNRFTRIPGENKCHTVVGASAYFPMHGYTMTQREATNESILSMYVGLDVDGKPNDDYVLRRSLNSIATDNGANNSFINDRSYNCLLTDGIKDIQTDILFTKNGTPSDFNAENNYIRIANMENLKGIVSVGETFPITIFKSPKNLLSKRCNIGASVDVVEEVDEIVNNTLESVNIDYQVKYENNTDVYYTGNQYIGANGFYTLTELLKFKNKRLVIDGKSFETREMIPTNFYTDVRLSENDSSVQVSEIKRVSSSFDKFNSVTVYGDAVKATARNRQSIKDTKRVIEKEITDLSIKSQKSVEDKARAELNVVDTLDSQISFRIPKERIPYVKAGHVITISYPSQGIPTGYYQVLEIQDTFGRLPKLTVGKYSKTMASTYADLTLKNLEIDGNIRGDRYSSTSSPLTEALEPKVRATKLKITKTGGTTTNIGFNNLIGFNSIIGFVSGSGTTTTTILDEDLTEK